MKTSSVPHKDFIETKPLLQDWQPAENVETTTNNTDKQTQKDRTHTWQNLDEDLYTSPNSGERPVTRRRRLQLRPMKALIQENILVTKWKESSGV